MPKLPDLVDGNIIYAADINSRYDEVYQWAADVEAGGHALNGVGLLGIGTDGPQGPLQVNVAAGHNLLAHVFAGAACLSAVNDDNTANTPIHLRASAYHLITTSLPHAVNDAAAAAAGVAVGQLYRNGSVVMVRMS